MRNLRRRNHSRSPGETYLTEYPHLAHWIVQCSGCGLRGHRSDMPEYTAAPDDPTREWAAQISLDNLRDLFPELTVDEHGRCPTCSAALA